LVELARSGRTLSSLAKEFKVTDITIRSWLRQADLDTGRRTDGLTTEEKQELARLRKEVAKLRQERDILEQATAWFAQRAVGAPKKRSDS
jgi:transposase-like protein